MLSTFMEEKLKKIHKIKKKLNYKFPHTLPFLSFIHSLRITLMRIEIK